MTRTPSTPTTTIPCPTCGATVHRTDWDDNHGFHTHVRLIDPQPLTELEVIGCIIAGRRIHTHRTDITGRHWYGHPSPWHPADQHHPTHRCGHPFPAPPTPEPTFELIAPPTTDTIPF